MRATWSPETSKMDPQPFQNRAPPPLQNGAKRAPGWRKNRKSNIDPTKERRAAPQRKEGVKEGVTEGVKEGVKDGVEGGVQQELSIT